MAQTAVINIKVNPLVKTQAQQVSRELGFSLSALINGYLKQLIKTGTVYFRTDIEQPNEYTVKMLKESAEDIKQGRVVSFKNPDKAVDYIDSLIKEDEQNAHN